MLTTNEIIRPIQNEFQQFEQTFESVFRNDLPMLDEVLHYIHTKRGKQLRPQLVLLSAALCRGITGKTIHTAVALELLHTASLVHDDVVDSSPMRRGAKAVQEVWGNKIAILVGDYMLSEVIAIINTIRNLKILHIVADMGASLSMGELLQLHSGNSMWITEKQYFEIIEHKTACLFSACTEAGAESSGGTQRQVSALREFGRLLGICFQIKDDVFDFSDSEDLGKPTMNDICDGKVTLPLIVALSRAPREEAEEIRTLAESLTKKEAKNVNDTEQTIKSFVLRYDGIGYATRQMQRLRKQAIEVLSIFPDSSRKDSLMALLDYAINRTC